MNKSPPLLPARNTLPYSTQPPSTPTPPQHPLLLLLIAADMPIHFSYRCSVAVCKHGPAGGIQEETRGVESGVFACSDGGGLR